MISYRIPDGLDTATELRAKKVGRARRVQPDHDVARLFLTLVPTWPAEDDELDLKKFR
jgi:hypothetical protein